MVFEKKKIQIETLGEYLREVREGFGLSLEEVAAKTGIKPKFLEYLEEGGLLKLPPDVYVLGFLRQLSILYSIESDELIRQYKKERHIQDQMHKQAKSTGSWMKKASNKIVITPKYVSLAVGVAFVGLTVGYIIWQMLSINKTPALEIFEPQDRQIIKGSFVEVKGKTDPGVLVTVNGQNIFVNSEGGFSTQLGINPGPKELAVVARNKFDKSITKTVSVVGEIVPASESQEGGLQLKLEFSDEVSLSISIDEQPVQTTNFHNGDIKLVSAKSKVVISTSNAGATKATLNGQALGPLGRPGEKLDNIPFFGESGNIK